MGSARLCGVLLFYSRHFRVFSSASTSAASSATSGLSTRVTCVTELFGRVFVQQSCHTAKTQLVARRSFSTLGHPPRDVTLFEHDRTYFFRLLSLFCGGQLIFWTYMANFAYTELRSTRGTKEKEETKPSTTPTQTKGLAGIWGFEMNLGSNAWRYGFTLGCLVIGAGIVGLGILFCRRSVNKVVLHQGGKLVTVCMQSPLGPGRGQRITVPLSEVACCAHRLETPSFIPLKVKGHRFYYLLDKEGTLTNAKLFDITVGAYRPF